MTPLLLCATAVAITTAAAAATTPLDRPMLGWSTWNTFACHVNATLMEQSIDALAASPLLAAGYNWVLLDDCWTTCARFKIGNSGACAEPGARDAATGEIVVDPVKFPRGFAPLTARAHEKGLRIGIYTSVSPVTCGGFVGSMRHEAVDAASFVRWGFDMVKHDTCGHVVDDVHNGAMQAAVARMRDALWSSSNGTMVYYLDSGNPTSPQRVYNPRQIGVTDQESLKKLAIRPSELAWVWALDAWANDTKGPHMLKSWFDRKDTWGSVLTNAHNQVRIAEFQRCGQFHMPDMLTIGMGGQSKAQYRAQFFLWAVLGAPLVMGNDIRDMDATTVALVTAPEVLAVDQDADCVQGSLATAYGATETWIKPLADKTFAVVLLNKGDVPSNATVSMNSYDIGWAAGGDFFPAMFAAMRVRDLFARKELGLFIDSFTTTVGPNDAAIFKFTPVLPAPGGTQWGTRAYHEPPPRPSSFAQTRWRCVNDMCVPATSGAARIEDCADICGEPALTV